MSLLDTMGKVAMDALSKAVERAADAKQKIDPLLDKSPIAAKLRDKIIPAEEDVEVPQAEVLRRPFETAPKGEEAQPLADASLAAQLFGRGTDPWTGRARQLLRDHQVEHVFVDLAGQEGLGLETRLMRETGEHGGLYVFLRGKYVGGYHALNEITRLGQLEELIKLPEERKQVGRVRIVIPTRGGDDTPMGERGN